MKIQEKYRSFGEHTVLFIIAVAVAAVLMLSAVYHMFSGIGSPKLAFNEVLLYIVFLGILYLTMKMKSSFVADESSVTFHQPFRADTVIYYRDIESIEVSAQMEIVKSRRYTDRRYYVETIVIRTFDDEYVFRGIMDAVPDLFMTTSDAAEKIPKFGRFVALKNFIDAQMRY